MEELQRNNCDLQKGIMRIVQVHIFISFIATSMTSTSMQDKHLIWSQASDLLEVVSVRCP